MDYQRRDLGHQLDEAIARLKSLENENVRLRAKLYTDDLTGVANRALFNDKLGDLVDVAHQSKESLALMIADVDGLKRTNDNLGHPKGDELLKTVAHALEATSRASDLVGRLGGDEFYVLLPGFCPLGGQRLDELLEHTIQRYKSNLSASIKALELPEQLYVNVSFGIAILNLAETAEAFYHRVDKIAHTNKKAYYKNLSKRGIAFTDERV